MNGCIESGPALTYRRLDQTVEALVRPVEALLERLAPDALVMREADEAGHRFVVPIRFPDGIGQGLVVASLFRYRDGVRVDVEIQHNRVLARPDGTPSDRRCYLNDFVASVTLSADAERLPPDFERRVLKGVHAAREAVQRHNREQQAPWNQVTVVAV